MPTAAPTFALALALSLLYLLVGHPAFLMLLVGNVDPAAERRLAKDAAAARDTLLRLTSETGSKLAMSSPRDSGTHRRFVDPR